MKNSVLGKGWTAIFFSVFFLGNAPSHAFIHSADLTLAVIQQQNVSGIVTDAGGPMPGVTIINAATSRAVVSDDKGAFTIDAAIGDTLILQFIGYATQSLTVTSADMGVFTLTQTADSLEELTINAGYYAVSRQQATGSISRISAAEIEKQPVTNFLATMQGRMPGVDISQNTGTPGGGFDIRIRGINSLRAGGNEPLYIIDGVPFSSESIGWGQTSATQGATSPLNSINPGDIASIEVLKDADATAIYGSRGANGVVLITTKKGTAGKTKVSINASTGFGTVTRLPKLMDTRQYLEMRRRAYANDGITSYPADAYDVNGTWDQGRYTDWQDVFLGGTAEVHSLQASISGGSEQTQYLVSGTYRNETTVLPGDFNYAKGAVHVNLNHTSKDEKFRLQFSSGYTDQKNNQPGYDPTLTSRILAPNAPQLYDALGNLNWKNSTWINPMADLRQTSLVKSGTLMANSTLSYEPLEGMLIKASMGYNEVQNIEEFATPSTIYDPAYGVGSEYATLQLNNTARKSWIIEPQLSYKRSFGKLALETLIGTTFQKQSGMRLYQSGRGFASNSLLHNLAAASVTTVAFDDNTIYKYNAAFARVNLNYDGRYILNLTGRRDGSSRFGPGRQFANFGAVGAAWLFSNEGFLKDNTILSFGKLRGSFGTSGNDQIGDYQFLDTYTPGSPYQGVIGLTPTRLFNPQFAWESNRKLEAALELGFLNDRIFLTAGYYRNRSSNQLVGIPLPGTTGFSTLTANLDATVQNSGLELSLRTENIKGPNFSWVTNFNISSNRNKLVSFPGLENSTYSNRYVVGAPLSIQKLYHLEGVDPTTGVYQFKDFNNDGTITPTGDRQSIVDLTPEYFGGLQNQLSYKGLQLDFLFQFVKQRKMNVIPATAGVAYNQSPDVLNSWQQPGDHTPYQQLTTGVNAAAVSAFYQYIESDGAVVDGSFIRLKNIALSYELPLPEKTGFACRLSLQGQNLLTFTKYTQGDPESRFNNVMPPLKMYTAGILLTF